MHLKNTCILILFAALFSAFNPACVNNEVELPTPLKKALEAYKEKGVEQFIPTLLKGSPAESDETALSQVNNIRQIEDFCGSYIGYEMVGSGQVVESTREVYYVLNYEKCPVFGRVTAYKTAQGEFITEFEFRTNIGEIIPRELIFKK